MKLRFTTKDENIKPFVCLRHVQMSIKCIFVLTPMTLRFTAKGENIKAFVYLRHRQMSIKCIFVLNQR
jgi:hypothetical protein